MISKRIQELEESATMAVDAKAKELKAAGKDIVSFAAGQPDFPTPDNVKNAAKQALDDNFTGYTAASGIIELKKAICAKFKRDNNIEYDPSEIIASNGAKHTLHNIFEALLNAGDEVIIPVPYWVSYSELVKLAEGTYVLAQTTEDNKVTAELIEQKISDKTRMIVLNSPSNPTGMICEIDEIQKIADLAVQHDLWVISDEVYEHFLYGDKQHVSIASLNDKIKDRTITVNSVSKTYSMTGWRLGYCGGPKEIINAMAKLQSQSTGNPSSISQRAAIEALSGQQESVQQMKAAFEKRKDIMVFALNAMKNISCATPEGAFYCFANISQTGMSSTEFATKLLEEANVAVVPGIAFGDGKFIRLSYACSEEQIKKGMKMMKSFCDSL